MGTLVFGKFRWCCNLIGPNTASTVNFTLPSADGTSGQALVTNGSGTLSFSTFTSGAAGSNTQVQFNSSGAFAGSANLTFNGTTLTAANTSVTTSETLSYGTANGVAYLNGSKVVTTGSALTFDGTTLKASLGSSGATAVSNGNTFVLENSAAVGMSLLTPDANASRIYFGTASNNRNAFIYSDYNSGAQTLIFGLGSGATAATEQMRLTSTGLGIGTSSPAAKLHVVSGAVEPLRLGSTTSGYNYITHLNVSSGVVGYLGDGLSAVTGYAATDYAIRANQGNLLFATNGNNVRAIIDTSGNLGLGVTPSAWASSPKAFQIGTGGGAISAFSNEIDISLNSYYNGGYKYVGTGRASLYFQYDGQHIWNTAASGTAGNAITFTQAMTLDASGRLGIGTTSPSAPLNVYSASSADFDLSNSTAIHRITGSGTDLLIRADYGNTGASSTIQFSVDGTERARIDSSGNLLVGTTSIGYTSSNSTYYTPSAAYWINNHATGTASGTRYVGFGIGINEIGSITQNGTTAVAYNTTSDYRLKEDVAPMTGALAKVAALKPVTYKWKVDGSDGEGFIAHELQAVVPQCVTGEKDAVDAEGNPQYQGIDTSFLVATLTAALQEQQAIIEQLKADVAALKGN